MELYERYKKNLLGVISDVGSCCTATTRPRAKTRRGHRPSCRRIRPTTRDARPAAIVADRVRGTGPPAGAGFIAKNSKTLLTQLHEYIAKEFAFGEFLFKDPDTGAEIGRAKDLTQMQQMIATIPDKAFEYHTSQKPPFEMALFGAFAGGGDPPGQQEPVRFDPGTSPAHRQPSSRIPHAARPGRSGAFRPGNLQRRGGFARIGEGSLGGKARGLAFMNSMILKAPALTTSTPTCAS